MDRKKIFSYVNLLCKLANALTINVDHHLLGKRSRCIVSAASKDNDPCGIGLLGLSSKTARPHTPGPILICKGVHKDNEVDVNKRLWPLNREELTDLWASFRRSCLMDVVKTPLVKVSADTISDWSVSDTVDN